MLNFQAVSPDHFNLFETVTFIKPMSITIDTYKFREWSKTAHLDFQINEPFLTCEVLFLLVSKDSPRGHFPMLGEKFIAPMRDLESVIICPPHPFVRQYQNFTVLSEILMNTDSRVKSYKI